VADAWPYIVLNRLAAGSPKLGLGYANGTTWRPFFFPADYSIAIAAA
jgi:hypothetical protein